MAKKPYPKHRKGKYKWASHELVDKTNAGSHLAFRRRVRAVAAIIKLERGCIDCGYRGHFAALDFDHVRGEKKQSISNYMAVKGMLDEIEKCDVRCSNCHRIRSWEVKNRDRTLDVTDVIAVELAARQTMDSFDPCI